MSTAVFRMVGSKSGDWEVRIEHPKAVAVAVGPDVLAAFYKCFVALDRVTAIEHMMFVVHEHSERTGVGRQAASIERDYHMLMLMMAGTMYELGIALQNLSATQVHMRLADRSTWEPLEAIRKRWRSDPMANTLRNGFAHHLGEIDVIKAGIDKSPDTVVFQRGTGLRRGEDRFLAPWDAVLAGEGVRDEVIEPFLKRMSADHRGLRPLLFDFFTAVAQHHGVPYIDESSD